MTGISIVNLGSKKERKKEKRIKSKKGCWSISTLGSTVDDAGER